MELKAGDRVDRFVLREQLGEGGQGAVWRAEDPLSPNEPRALKLVLINPGRPNDVERVRREARALARLEHPSLVACHGLFEDLKLGVVGVVMDYVDGKSLRSAERDGRFGQKHRAAALRHVAHALAYLHESGIVHRDLKLDNVVVNSAFFDAPDEPRHVKVVDLGIAAVKDAPQKLTALGTIVGTIAYLSPELLDPATFAADEAAQAIDVFAFGVLGWQLLTGEHPTGLPGSAALVDYVRAYRDGADKPAWPPGAPAGAWGALLVDALAIRQASRIPNGIELAKRCDAAPSEAGGVIVRPSGAAEDRPELAPTSVASPAAMHQPTVASAEPAGATAAIGPTPRAATLPPAAEPERSKSGWIWAVLGVLAVGGVGAFIVTTFRTENTIVPQPSASARPTASVTPAPPKTAVVDATADAETELDAESDAAFSLPIGCNAESGECDCCPSGHDCAPGKCTDPLAPDEGWHLRLAEMPKNGEQDLFATHSTAEVCIKLADVKQWTCSPVRDLADGGISSTHLYASTLDLTEKGVDVLVRFPLPGNDVKSPLASAERVKYPNAPRAVLCKGLEVKLEGNVPIERVRFFVDDDDGPAPARKPCP